MQESLCEKWFLQHFYGYRCNVAGYRFYGLGDLEGIATTYPRLIALASLSLCYALGFDLACSFAHHTISTFSVIAKVGGSTLAIITFFFIPVGGRDGKR